MDRIREYNFLMAHFAEIDSNNVVQRVVVVSNSDTVDLSGVETESVGAAFCQHPGHKVGLLHIQPEVASYSITGIFMDLLILTLSYL